MGDIIIAWLLADLIAGIVHWIEDRYLDERNLPGFMAGVAVDNTLHHKKPTAMLLHSWWGNMRTSALFAWPISIVALIGGLPLWLWLGIALSAFGNVVHRWAHTPKSQLPKWIRVFQESGLFIAHNHHDIHHRYMGSLIGKELASRAYCPMTNILNPFLDWLNVWTTAETLLRKLGLRTVDQGSFEK